MPQPLLVGFLVLVLAADVSILYNPHIILGAVGGAVNPALVVAERGRSTEGQGVPMLLGAQAADVKYFLPTVSSNWCGQAPTDLWQDYFTASPTAIRMQIERVANARGMAERDVFALVGKFTEREWLKGLGQQRVNLLALNLALDGRTDVIVKVHRVKIDSDNLS